MAERYEYYITGDDSVQGARNGVWKAQTFTPSIAHTITSVKLKLCREGSPGTVTVSIRATDGEGHPTGEDLCVGTTNGNTLPTAPSFEWREIYLFADLSADTKYAIVCRITPADPNRINMLCDSTSPAYARGQAESSVNSGVDWNTTPNDWMFEEWGVIEDFVWTRETDVPFEAGESHYFSPIVKSADEYIVYCLFYSASAGSFWKYNLTTGVWTELEAPPGNWLSRPRQALALSPDGTTLCCPPRESNVLHFYDISGNSWTTSSAAPPVNASSVMLRGVVWQTDDILWAFARYGETFLKAYKYVKSTDTWTQFANTLETDTAFPQGCSINTAGTILYLGSGQLSTIKKYVIATDTYSNINAGSGIFAWCFDRNARIWWFDTATFLTYYFNCDTETNSDAIVADNAFRTKTDYISYGIHENFDVIIAWHRSYNPADWSSVELLRGPTVTTDPATSVEAASATLNGTLDDDGGVACDVRFQYGETIDYGIDTEWQSGKESVVAFEQAITGLLPNTTYHFRALATNSAGTSYGADRSLTTMLGLVINRAYTLSREEL